MMSETVNNNVSPPRDSGDSTGVSHALPEMQVTVQTVEDSEVNTRPDGGNDSTKAAWNRSCNAGADSGLIMAGVAWPTLSESTLQKPFLDDDSKNPHNPRISLPQVTAANESSPASPQKQTTSKPNKPIPNATQHYGRPARQKSMKHEGGGSSSSDGGFSQSSSMGDTSHASYTLSKASSGGSDISARDHGHVNVTATREGAQRSGGDRPQQRNYRRSNSGSQVRGDGSFGGRRDHDRRNQDWNHQRSFSGRDSVMSPQRAAPSGFIRPPPLGATTYFPPPPMPFGSLMGIPPEMPQVCYFAPQPGMSLVAQMPPAVYYPPLDSELHLKIINQIEYYFSNDNLIKDIYLRNNMDEYGWVPIQLIANFKKVKELTTDIQLILDALRSSTVVEVQGNKIRKCDDWMRWMIPSSPQFADTSGTPYPRMLQDTRPGLTLEDNTAKLQL